MIEEKFELPTEDGFKIHGIINKAEGNKKAIIFCHGLGQNMYDYHFQVAKSFFPEKGYDVIRFDFYTGEEGGRNIKDCTVAVHGKDFDVVLGGFEASYDKIYAVGHSYGGLTLLVANNSKTSAVSLWDSTYDTADWKDFWMHIKEFDMYSFKGDPLNSLVGKDLYEENLIFQGENIDRIVSKFIAPAQVVAAGENLEHVIETRERLYKNIGSPSKEYCLIEGADHCFNKGNVVFDLLENTYKWFEGK